jgi:sulfur-oxidizing protein SoxY
MMEPDKTRRTRRELLRGAGALALGGTAAAMAQAPVPALAQSRVAEQEAARKAAMQEAIRQVVGEAKVTEAKVVVDIPPLVENGNTVPCTVTVESPMTAADHVKAIHVFTEKNPQPYVISVGLGPRAGRASISTRMRLRDSQTVLAIAEMSDGTFWSGRAHVIVTISACLEDIL